MSCQPDDFLSDQVFPLHPLDVVPKSATDPNNCIGSFVPLDIPAIASGNLYVVSLSRFGTVAKQNIVDPQ